MQCVTNKLQMITKISMRITSFLILLLTISQLVFTSCKKSTLNPQTKVNEPVVPTVVPETPAEIPTKESYNRTINVGIGSGNLTIDGNTFDFKCNDLILIAGGKYNGIEIKNIRSADGCPITIKNDGLVEVSGDFNQMTLSNLKNLTISGNGTNGLAKGFLFRDNKYRAIQMSGMIDKFTLQHIEFKNIKDADISYQYKKTYDGSEDSYSKDLKFLNISCENTSGLLSFAGGIENGIISGLVRNIEVAYVDFKNSPDAGSVVYMGNVEDFDIHDNRINNINTINNNHNGVFSLSGNGKFYNNLISNHQGNSIRAWGHSIGRNPKTLLIYNNIVVNSRKYSGFEVQAFSDRMISGSTTFVNAAVFNNTCGNLNLSNDWQGNVVDVYSLKGGKCDVYNNLAYNFQPGSVIAGQQAELVPNSFNNLYFKTISEAGIVDEKTFTLTANSPAKAKGVSNQLTVKDFYGKTRGSQPSIGAIE